MRDPFGIRVEICWPAIPGNGPKDSGNPAFAHNSARVALGKLRVDHSVHG